jgi:hypothetical protein
VDCSVAGGPLNAPGLVANCLSVVERVRVRRIFQSMKEEISGGWIQLHD